MRNAVHYERSSHKPFKLVKVGEITDVAERAVIVDLFVPRTFADPQGNALARRFSRAEEVVGALLTK